MEILERKDLVKKVRKKMGLTQIEFAKKMGVVQSAVSTWETAEYEFTDDRLFKLKHLFEKETGNLEFSRSVFTPFINKILEG